MDEETLEFRCTDIGLKCDVRITGKTEPEQMMRISEHARDRHGITNPDEETVKAIKGAIKVNRGD